MAPNLNIGCLRVQWYTNTMRFNIFTVPFLKTQWNGADKYFPWNIFVWGAVQHLDASQLAPSIENASKTLRGDQQGMESEC